MSIAFNSSNSGIGLGEERHLLRGVRVDLHRLARGFLQFVQDLAGALA